MANRFSISIVGLCSLLTLCSANFDYIVPRGTHNLIMCNSYDGIFSHSERVTVEAALFRVNEYVVTYPPYGISNDIITCLRVIDRVMNNRGGYIEIKNGGVGYKDVQIRLTSQRGRKMDFDIQIYAQFSSTTSTASTAGTTSATEIQ